VTAVDGWWEGRERMLRAHIRLGTQCSNHGELYGESFLLR
jgi:hypothetical protein